MFSINLSYDVNRYLAIILPDYWEPIEGVYKLHELDIVVSMYVRDFCGKLK